MENEVLEDIARYARKKLAESYGYCGEAKCAGTALLNSEDQDGNEIKITIKLLDEG